jgi:hypothetical protein
LINRLHVDPLKVERAIQRLKQEMKMNEPKSRGAVIKETLTADAIEAAWRLAGSQLVKTTREPLVALLTRHLGADDPSMRAKVAAFLETDLGSAMLSAMLSVGLTAMPGTMGGVPERLAKELRIKSMAETGDLVADVLMGPLRTVMSLYLKDVPVETPAAQLGEGSSRLDPSETVDSTIDVPETFIKNG